MTDKGKKPASSTSLSTEEATSPLTLADLLAVLTMITGGDIPARAIVDRLRGPTAHTDPTGSDDEDYETLSALSASSAETSGGEDGVLDGITPDPSSAPPAAAPVTIPGPPNAPVPPVAGPSTFVDPSTRWYTIFVGRRTGVFAGWATVSPLVVGVAGACYCKFSSRALAEAAFEEAQEVGGVRSV